MTALIQALLDPACYPHPVQRVRLIETHISWVLLTGLYAYKIKKPVDLGFVDFHTLAKRRHYCAEEVRLNRRFAPNVYLDVVPIAGPPTQPRVDGAHAAIEYAVRMREFDQSALLSTLLDTGHLEPTHIDALADRCAKFHADADFAHADQSFGDPAQLLRDALANFDAIAHLLPDDQRKLRLRNLRQWTIDTHARLTPIFAVRKSERHIRECHGDLHLRNIVLVDGEITMFDCIEFNQDFRWIDTMNEVAFIVMDLATRGRCDFAHRLLNRYLEAGGDYAGLDVLRFYLVYRAMVRAKVDCIRASQNGTSDEARHRELADFDQRLELAEQYAQPRPSFLAITCGLSGSGKTHLSELALERTGAIRLRSDVERKRLSGVPPSRRSNAGLHDGIYATRTSDLTFARLERLTRKVLDAGFSVIVDATFIQRDRRLPFASLAAAGGVPFVILHCYATAEVLEDRIAGRRAAGNDASEADIHVMRHQKQIAQPLAPDEAMVAIEIDTEQSNSVEAALDRLDAIGGTSASHDT